MEDRGARKERDRLLAGVDEIEIFLARLRGRPDAENAVLAVIDHLAVARHVVGRERRQADAEIHVGAVGDIAPDAAGNLVTRQRFGGHVSSLSWRLGVGDLGHAGDGDAGGHDLLPWDRPQVANTPPPDAPALAPPPHWPAATSPRRAARG